jgi:hypothetical protein
VNHKRDHRLYREERLLSAASRNAYVHIILPVFDAYWHQFHLLAEAVDPRARGRVLEHANRADRTGSARAVINSRWSD